MIFQKTIGAALSLMAWSFVAAPQPWLQSFPVDVKELATQGESAYFVLKPGYQATFEGRIELWSWQRILCDGHDGTPSRRCSSETGRDYNRVQLNAPAM